MVGCRPGGQLDGGDPEGPDVRLVVVSGHLPKNRKNIIGLILEGVAPTKQKKILIKFLKLLRLQNNRKNNYLILVKLSVFLASLRLKQHFQSYLMLHFSIASFASY